MPPLQPSFASLGVPSDIVAALDRKSITEPFPIQSATIPDALAGRDVCGKAPTGSGKTLAFGIGAVARLHREAVHDPSTRGSWCSTPTRELAAQVATELQVLADPAEPAGGLVLRRRRVRPAAEGPVPGRRRGRRLSRGGSATSSSGGASASTPSRSSSSTRPTAWPTWVSSPTSGAFST